MNFIKHSNLEGQHAFLGASKYHWLNYDEEKLKGYYHNFKASEKGTELHAFAATCIKLRQRLPKSKRTLNSYVNDAIGYGMTPEQILYYSQFCFGTADAIMYNGKTLRIHDLKTGTTPTHVEQVRIYAALFCLEYGVNPEDIEIVLRIYQNDEVVEDIPEGEEIRGIMNKIIHFDKILYQLQQEDI